MDLPTHMKIITDWLAPENELVEHNPMVFNSWLYLCRKFLDPIKFTIKDKEREMRQRLKCADGRCYKTEEATDREEL
ncbi:MAG: hypothetical protein LBH42_08730 [Treponema sp.]|nr:hypothetical protein [Treponema sp.]